MKLRLSWCLDTHATAFVSYDPISTHFMLRAADEKRTPIGTIRCYDSSSADLPVPESKTSNILESSRTGDEAGAKSRNRRCRAYHLGRLVVLPAYRKFGFGRDLVLALHEWARSQAEKDELHSVNVVLWGQIPAVPFYTR